MALYHGSTKTHAVLNTHYTSDTAFHYTTSTGGSTFLSMTFTTHTTASKHIVFVGGTGYGLSGCRFRCHALPTDNNTYDLGSSSLRWRNVYTNDLNLSNEGSKNDVDGTWGNYTIQEGESDLFLINKRNGKKYKFNLTEVS